MIQRALRFMSAALICGLSVLPAPAQAQSLAAEDSFRIGARGSLLCTAQTITTDGALTDMFDRGYSITCRDAATSVGQAYALRERGGDPVGRLAALRNGRATCQPGDQTEIEALGAVETLDCRLTAADVAWRVYIRRSGPVTYVAEGLAGYDSAIRLALRSVIADRIVDGEVSIATTGAGDPVAFARVQAGSLDRRRALAEAYRRNNAGSFAESAEFFAVLTEGQPEPAARVEAIVNEAMQRSNLGRYGEADALFSRAEGMAANPVAARRLRNYRAMHLLNQGFVPEALVELNRPMPDATASGSVAELVIDSATASRLSAESPGAQRIAGIEGLTEQDKARILDGQAEQLRGVIHRLGSRNAEAAASFNRALEQLVAIRGGRIAATMWLRAQILGDLADIAEAEGNRPEAEARHLAAVALLEANYPGSFALFSAKGRLAAHYARTGRADDALALFRQIVAANGENGPGSPALRRTLQPYFALLAERGADPAAAAELFAASQVIVRPGVAQTQAVFARELSGGTDEASRLFRQSLNLTRDVERARVELARLEAREGATSADGGRAATLREMLAQLQQDQVATQGRLAEFPRYRVAAGSGITLVELQQQLRPGEGYYKMIVVDDAAYAVFVTTAGARAYRLPFTPAELDTRVNALRETISVVRNGQQLTFPFNVEASHRLYRDLFGPVDGEVAGVTHLIFEADGAMLRLPPNLLVMDQASVDAYRTRVAASRANEFDFRGVAWLGRQREISTAISARAFRDVRMAPASRARSEYLGFGQNAPPADTVRTAGGDTRSVAGGVDCSWPLAAWRNPIAAAELFTARGAIRSAGPDGSQVVTGQDFTDTAIRERTDLRGYRILHFATHGLVTGPRPECPAQPALLTSFGGESSDGLLTFSEIFDLQLDADLIVLSACDTAGRAGLTATEEAGLTSGGDFALDGLVRAFVGAGSRIIVASHWPVPDSFNATQRLISGLFTATPGTSVAGAMHAAELRLMDEADTSHPYYWSGFAVIGDGSAPVLRATAPATAAD